MSNVRITSITKYYGTNKIIDNVSLVIKSGEFVTLLGPSGSGKTTTLKIVAGLEMPNSGSVSIGDVDMTRVPVSKRKIGMVFQSLALFPHMTVAENVAFGLRMRRLGRSEIEQRVRKALELVQLTKFAERIPEKLSGGQQQRVALARAFVINPTVLLLDEPLGSLDRKLREEMQVEIRQLVRQLGMTAIFVTHDQEEALILSDRVAVMNHGIVEQIAPPTTLFRKPCTAFVAEFMGVANLLEGRVSLDNGRVVEATENANTLRFAIGQMLAPGARVRIGLRPEDGEVVLTRPENSQNHAACRVDTIIYQGAMIAMETHCLGAPTIRLRARVSAGITYGDGSEIKPGQTIWLLWRSESILVYSD